MPVVLFFTILALGIPTFAEAEGPAVPWVDVASVAVGDFPLVLGADPQRRTQPGDLEGVEFRLRPSSHFSLGYTRSTWWLRFDAVNSSDKAVDRVLRDEDGFMMDHLDLFVVSGKTILQQVTEGISVPADQKAFRDSGAVFLLHLDPGETKSLFLRAETKSPFLVSLSLQDFRAYHQDKVLQNVFYAAVFGGILLMLLYNLFLFFSLKSPEYFWYVAYVTAALVYIAAQSGFAIEHFGVSGELRGELFYSVYVVAVAMFLFSRIVLEVPAKLPRWNGVTLIFLGANLFGIVLGLVFGLKNTLFIQSPLILVSSVSLLAVGIAALVKGVPTAKYYIAANGIFLLSTAVVTLLFLGILPYSFLTRNAYFLGILVEATLLSLLLSYRIHLLRQATLDTQAALLETEHQLKEELEEKVAVRTKELAEAKEAADVLARVDALTGLLNRRALFERGEAEAARCQRCNRVLAVVMADLDWFKAINDNLGHAAGDEALRWFSRLLTEEVRLSDGVGRLGGEEFVLLLPESSASEARLLADRVRRRMSADSEAAGPVWGTLTASFGVAERGGEEPFETLLARADKALYQAKAQGRNRVVVEGEVR